MNMRLGFPLPGLLLLILLVTRPLSAWAIPVEEVVPAGAWFLKFSEHRVTQESAIDRHKQERILKSYVIPNPDQAEATTGDIQRERAETESRITFGLTDSLNLALRLPLIRFSQSSTLANDSAEDADRSRLTTLGDEEISGVGDVRVSLLYRPVFTDRNAFLWGFGLITPGSEPQTPYVDSSSLELGGLTNRVLLLIQYTRFPMVSRSRFDLVFEGINGVDTKVRMAGGGQGTLEPGTVINAKMGWLQEIGMVSLGMETEYSIFGNNRLQGQGLHDNSLRWVYRLQMGLGNLAVLEEPGGGFPYRVMVGQEHVLRGFNTPTDPVTTLSLETYF